jgi:predicted HicB family RNase H-like nuclease
MTAKMEQIVRIPEQLERTARLIAAARGEDINAVVCAALREYVGAVPL